MGFRLASASVCGLALLCVAAAGARPDAAVMGPGVVFTVFESLPPKGACPGLYAAEERTRRIEWLGGWDAARQDFPLYPAFTSRGTLSYGYIVDRGASDPLVDVYAGNRRVARTHAFLPWIWSPSHEELAYGRASADGRRLELVVTTIGGATQVLAPSARSGFAWLPDGSALVYERRVGTTDLITYVRRDGHGRKDIARNAAAPLVSPDGRTVAFVRTVSRPSERSRIEIWTVPSRGGPARRLLGPISGRDVRPAGWLSDRLLLLQRGGQPDAIFNSGDTLNRLDVKTRNERLFMKRAFALSLSPDRKRLLVVRRHTAAGETYYSVRTVDLAGRNARVLGVVDEEDLNIRSVPVWKPARTALGRLGDPAPAPVRECEQRVTALRDATS